MVIPRFPCFSCSRFGRRKSFWREGNTEDQCLNGEYGKIFERGKFGLRDYFSAFYISCVVGFELLERCYSL